MRIVACWPDVATPPDATNTARSTCRRDIVSRCRGNRLRAADPGLKQDAASSGWRRPWSRCRRARARPLLRPPEIRQEPVVHQVAPGRPLVGAVAADVVLVRDLVGGQ